MHILSGERLNIGSVIHYVVLDHNAALKSTSTVAVLSYSFTEIEEALIGESIVCGTIP